MNGHQFKSLMPPSYAIEGFADVRTFTDTRGG